MLKGPFVLLIVGLVAFALSAQGCKRYDVDYGFIEAPQDAPPYTLQAGPVDIGQKGDE